MAVVLTLVAACADGMTCHLEVRVHPSVVGAWDPGRLSKMVHGPPLSFGFGFADGSKAVHPGSIGMRAPWEKPDSPVICFAGGGGSRLSQTLRLWVWPLPPAGLITVVVASEELGIPETRASIDATPIRDAATRSVTLWPDDRAFPPPPRPFRRDQ